MEYNLRNRVDGIVIDIYEVSGAIDWGGGYHFVRGEISN